MTRGTAGLLLVKPRSLGADVDRIAQRVAERHRVALLDNPAELANVTRDEWDVVAGPGSMICDARLFDRLRRLRAVIAVGSGIEGIDRIAASERGILIGDGAVEENIRDMASATVMLILALSHDLDGVRRRMHDGSQAADLRSRSVSAQTIGLIGFGRIARAVIAFLAPWRPRILVHSPRLDSAAIPPGVERVSLDDLLAQSDLVSIHASLNAETRGLLDAAALRRMKPSAVLINTARGEIVDESAVAEALNAGLLRGAAFDCFAVEPLPSNSPLRNARNIILTPHAVGHTVDGVRAVAAMFEANILAALDGQPPHRVRNPEALTLALERRRSWSETS